MTPPEEEKPSGTVTRRGLLLKETREGKGLSIETVHEMTKIPLDVLHAIEEGYTVRMVSAYYFKGFIKMYAKFLGLDPALVLDEPIVPIPTADQPAPGSVVNDAEHRKFNEFLTRQNKKQMAFGLIVGGAGLVLAIIIFVFLKMGDRSEQPAVKKISFPAAGNVKVKPKSEQKTAKAASEKKEGSEEKDRRSVGKKVSLTVKARLTGWLQVKVDGSVVWQSTMHEGTVETWQAEKSIEISGKNINNLEFEVNGKVLGQLGKSDRGARRVIVTSEGLSVIK